MLYTCTDDKRGLVIFDPFRNLPTRALLDYYQVIKHPVSLSGVKKRTVGKHGREAATGITDFKSWDAFEQEVSFIWKNARTYNEDGSEMYNLAGEFEVRLTISSDHAQWLICSGTFQEASRSGEGHSGRAFGTAVEAEC